MAALPAINVPALEPLVARFGPELLELEGFRDVKVGGLDVSLSLAVSSSVSNAKFY